MNQHAIEGMNGRRGVARRSRRRPAQPRNAAETRLFETVEAVFNVGGDDLHAATRGRGEIAFARQTGMYLARVVLGMTLSDAGHLFGRDRTTVSHACRRIEDLRDDASFDALLHAMETLVLRPDFRDGSVRQ